MTRSVAVAAALVFAMAACGDRTVTSSPSAAKDNAGAVTPTVVTGPAPASEPARAAAATNSSLDEVDRILDEVQTDLDIADREATSPEGDPTS